MSYKWLHRLVLVTVVYICMYIRTYSRYACMSPTHLLLVVCPQDDAVPLQCY